MRKTGMKKAGGLRRVSRPIAAMRRGQAVHRRKLHGDTLSEGSTKKRIHSCMHREQNIRISRSLRFFIAAVSFPLVWLYDTPSGPVCPISGDDTRQSGRTISVFLSAGILAKIPADLPDVQLSHAAQQEILFDDVADLHPAFGIRFVGLERHRDEIRAVQLLADDAGAERIAV